MRADVDTLLLKRAAQILATWFGCGLAPKAPGTVGTIGGMAVAWFLVAAFHWPPLAFAGLAIASCPIAMWAAGAAARARGLKDPGFVVIDEVLGVWITLAGARHFTLLTWILAFVLFRLFDIWKPAPIRQLERLPGGIGIVADDILAGVYAALVLFLVGWFNFE